MIDVLPTVLHLVGVPPPEIAQGQSLAHLMLGVQGWEPRPVILDEFVLDAATGEPTGVIEVIDGRWGASLHVNASATTSIGSRRSTPLLLYDLWEDPYLQRSLHDERRDLAAHYTAYLESQLEAHRALAGFFTSRPGPNPLTPEQLERLRTLGYIR
jgi:arylsulfatase A-like enzyme